MERGRSYHQEVFRRRNSFSLGLDAEIFVRVINKHANWAFLLSFQQQMAVLYNWWHQTKLSFGGFFFSVQNKSACKKVFVTNVPSDTQFDELR